MRIIIQKFSREEREAFFRKNKWLIYRLLGIKIQFPDLDNTQDGAPEPYKNPQVIEDLSEEEREEQLEEVKEDIEEVLDELEEDIMEMTSDGFIDEEEAQFMEDMGNAIDELQKSLDMDLPEAEADTDTAAEEETAANQLDDLTAINGLGPKTAQGLQELGITSFQQIANLTEEEIQALDEKIKNFANSYERKDFRQQAKDLL
jgi:predicted flap endonuclease-1-like 5' DNA nuclease